MLRSPNILFICLIGAILFLYALTLKGASGNIYPNNIVKNEPPFETSMERGRYAQIVAIAEYKTFQVDKFFMFLKPDLAWYGGHYYSAFPPGVATLAVPFYLIGKVFSLNQIFSSLISVLFTMLTLVVMYRVGVKLKLGLNSIFFGIIIFSLGSVAWPYTVSLTAHTASAFFVTLSYFLAIQISRNNSKNVMLFVWLWVTYIVNIFIDYPNLFIMLPSIFYALFQVFEIKQDAYQTTFKLKLFPFLALVVIIPVMSLFVVYNLKYYNQPIVFTNTYNLKRLEIQNVHFTYDTLSNDLFKQKNYSERFKVSKIFSGTQVLLVSDDRGLFFYSPIFIVSIFGFLRGVLKKNKYILLALALFFFNLFIYGSFDDAHGGWGFGPRYLIATLPLLAISGAYWLDAFWRKNLFIKVVIILFTLISIFIALSGALTTNAVPTKSEGVFLHLKYNYFYNLDRIFSGNISSFIYNGVFHSLFTPVTFFVIIFILSGLVALAAIFQKNRNNTI